MNNLSISHPSSAGRKHDCSCLKDKLRADLMRRTRRARIVESLCVKGKTEGSLDARTESLSVTKSKHTRVVDFSLDESSRVEVSLGANFERDIRGGGIGIIYSLRAGLNVGAHTVVIARGKGAQVGETMDSDRVLGCRETKSSRVLGDTAFSDVVRCFGTDKEAITTENSVGSKCETLEDVQNGARVKARLLVGGTEEDRFCVLLGVEDGCGVELEALGNLVLELDLVAERVVGGPGLSDGQAVGLVGVLALEVTRDVRRFRVTVTVDLEGDVRGGRGFDLEGGTVEVVVLAEEVIGGLAEVLPGWGNGLRQRH